MKTFLALALLSLAASVSTQAALSSPDSVIHHPKFSQVITGESDLTGALPRPKPRLTAGDTDTKRQPPRVMSGSVDGSDLLSLRQRPRFTAIESTSNRQLPRPKFRDSDGIRKPHFSETQLIAAQKRPKPPGVAVMAV